jgi:hypothetical protein
MGSRIKHLEGKFDDFVCCIVISILYHYGNQQFSHQQLSNETKAHTIKFLTLKLNALQQQCVMWDVRSIGASYGLCKTQSPPKYGHHMCMG